jgi:hypothetical protein
MADQKIELEIVLDDGSIKRAFATVRKESEETGDTFNNAFRVGGLADLNAGLNLVRMGIEAVARAGQFLLDQVLNGEKIDAINKRFDTLAKQQMINAEALRAGIAQASGGTVDLEDALQAAGRALINLQVGAAQIPQLFELAKKASAAFGTDTVENFERIQQAIISGNTRSLKEIGLFINAEEAYKRLASSIGELPKNLSEAGRQQAILNEIIRVGGDRFKNISQSISPVQESLKVLGVSFNELSDTVSLFLKNVLGPVLQGVFQNLANSFDILNLKMQQTLLGTVPTAAENVRLLNNELQNLTLLREQKANLANSQEEVAILDQQIEKLRERILIEQQLANQQATKNAVALQGNIVARETLVIQNELNNAQLEGIRIIQEVIKKQAEAAAAADLAAKQLNGAIKAALTNAIAQGVQNMAMALVKGSNVLSAFGKTILGVFGDLAIQTGTILIGIGLGLKALKTLNGFAAVAAGIGLVAIGGVLKALTGGAEAAGSNVGVTATGGGVAFTGDTQELIQQQDEQSRAPAQTGVQVIVQGNIFDSRETGLEIARIINDSFDLNGTIIRANA